MSNLTTQFYPHFAIGGNSVCFTFGHIIIAWRKNVPAKEKMCAMLWQWVKHCSGMCTPKKRSHKRAQSWKNVYKIDTQAYLQHFSHRLSLGVAPQRTYCRPSRCWLKRWKQKMRPLERKRVRWQWVKHWMIKTCPSVQLCGPPKFVERFTLTPENFHLCFISRL